MPDVEEEIEKKQLIAETAVDVFAENGFSETKVRQIADRAGVGKGTVYLYFDNKYEILYEVYLNFEAMLHDILDRALDESGDPAENARRLMDELVDMLESHRSKFTVLFEFWSHGLNDADEFDIPFKSFYNRIRKKFEVVLKDMVDEDRLKDHSLEDFTYVLIGIFEGQMVQWLMNPSSPDLDEMSSIVLDILFEGLSEDVTIGT